MNSVVGRIIAIDSGIGVPDVLVALYDVEGSGSSGEVPDTRRTRLGSVLTEADGSFRVDYDEAPQDGRPPTINLFLELWAADEQGGGEDRWLFRSSVRRGAGKTESYLIRLPNDVLDRLDVEVPSNGESPGKPPSTAAQILSRREAWQAEMVDASLAAARLRVTNHKHRVAPFRDTVRPAFTAELSAVPSTFHDASRFVSAGESVFAKSHAIIGRNLVDLVNDPAVRSQAPIRGIVTLTDDQRAQLEGARDADGLVSEEAIEQVTGVSRSSVANFVQRPDFTSICRNSEIPDCLDPPATEPTPIPEGPVVGENIEAATEGDLPRYIARIMGTMTSAEEELAIGLMPTASSSTVERNVQALAFRPSPADVPAFHDFNELQIAFQHVWQEAIDEDVLQIAEDAYDTIVELGGTPEARVTAGERVLEALFNEGKAAIAADRVVAAHGTGDELEQAVLMRVRDHRGKRNVRDHRKDARERLPRLLTELRKRLKGKYGFTIYAANEKERSVNFALLNTYRQTWTPLTYQAGALVKSIPLAPKQSQRLSITRKSHRKRTVRELENNLQSVRDEMGTTNRAEAEIARRASSNTTFSMSNTATANIEVGSDSHTTSFTQNAAKSADDIKKSFHEAVFKAAKEVREERTTEVNTEETEDFESTEVTDISNPNDEISVTFLFYELQRRYRVQERLHRVRPVVLVAQEVPKPSDIDIDWLVTYDWILKRVILDDSFLEAFTWLILTAGEETALAELRRNVEMQQQIVSDLREEVAIARRNAAVQRALLQRAVVERASDSGGGGLFSFVEDAVGAIAGVSPGVVDRVTDLVLGGTPPSNLDNRQAFEDAAERAADQARDAMFRMEREVTALNALLETYSKQLREHHLHLTGIARLQVHVKENILHYMQAIWSLEPPDQRFFRLHEVPIPTFRPGRRRFDLGAAAPIADTLVMAHMTLPRFGGRRTRGYRVVSDTTVDTNLSFRPLAEVADLDTLLGYKGNYLIFPLRDSNALTDFMMDPYVDRATGDLIDPSDPLPMTIEEFSHYVCCLSEHLTTEEFESIREQLRRQYGELLTAPRRTDDILVVPTDSLFIEALPAAETLLEPFKKAHRYIDVKKVQEEVRSSQIETVRKAARILTGDFEDPDIDRRVSIVGTTVPVVGDQ